MRARSGRKKISAIAAVLGLLLQPAAPVAAAGSVRFQGAASLRPSVSLAEFRAQVEALSNNPRISPKVRERAGHWLAIATAASRTERHRLVAKLPVKVTEELARDGRDGKMVHLKAGDKIRFSTFLPRESGGVTFESGPSVVDNAEDVCYTDDGVADDCATINDVLDLATVLVDVEAMLLEAESQTNSAIAECETIPGCMSAPPEAFVSGPDAGEFGCYAETLAALVAIPQGWAAYAMGTSKLGLWLGRYAAGEAMGVAVSTVGLTALGTWSAGVGVLAAGGLVIYCLAAARRAAVMPWIEPFMPSAQWSGR